MSSAIEWTDETWNPTTGCDRVSPGCGNCYAATMAKRLKAMGQPRYQTDGDPRTSGPGFGLAMHDDALEIPLRWRKPRRVFVNSMSDLFHPKVTDEFIAEVWAVMALSWRHTFQVLTKRPKRARALLSSASFVLAMGEAVERRGQSRGPWPGWPLPNVWLGTSVEDQQRADERIPPLLDTPAAVRFLSCEPLLGPVSFRWRPWVGYKPTDRGTEKQGHLDALDGIHWIIVGGESGTGARPMHPQWPRDLRDEAVAAGVPFFFKQWGSWHPADRSLVLNDPEWIGHWCGTTTEMWSFRRGSKHYRELDGRTWDEFPEGVPA